MIGRVLRLKYELGLSYRQIAAALGISTGTVANYVSAAARAGLSGPLPTDFDETSLLRTICVNGASESSPGEERAEPTVFAAIDFEWVHRELKHKGVTRQRLWEEYREGCAADAGIPYGTPYSYTQFCVLYQRWEGKLSRSMRQHHIAGDKLFVDYCGPTIPVTPAPGQIVQAQVFVAVLGASSYTYAEATWTQSSEDWIRSHVAAFEFFGGVPNLVVPDNLKSAVARSCRYEPLINASYAEMLAHYETTALPARPYKPRDKAKVEVGVQVVERWVLAKLRHRSFFTLGEVNRAIAELLVGLNAKAFKKLDGSRLSWFESIDRPALKPLPLVSYEYARWKKVRVHIDYHVEVQGHFYSVHHSLVKRELDARVTTQVVELFHGGKRVASHPRSLLRGARTTVPEHMPRAHQAHLDWTPQRFLGWARQIGPDTYFVVDHLLANRPHPEHGYRSCLGLLSLGKSYSHPRLEAACGIARGQGALALASVKSILTTGLDRLQTSSLQDELPFGSHQIGSHQSPDHENVRGAENYR